MHVAGICIRRGPLRARRIIGAHTLNRDVPDHVAIAIQGVRAYDPTSAQWTTPDAYSGDVHDPMSQKPFMYNGNNPIKFQDTTGYFTELAHEMNAGGDGEALLSPEEGSGFGEGPGGEARAGEPATDGKGGAPATGDGGTETVNRYGSRAEAEAVRDTNLVRAGRPGTHFATNDQ
jgi:RHS repeat-associated protein